MKNMLLFAAVVMFNFSLQAQQLRSLQDIHIVPKPVSVVMNNGSFALNKQTQIISGKSVPADITSFLSSAIYESFGLNPATLHEIKKGNQNEIVLQIEPSIIDSLGNEGYLLTVTPERISISANAPKGLFYGVQSLMQLLPPPHEEAESKVTSFSIPCVTIADHPRFAYRGMMLDVSRHFFSKDFIRKYIDEMAKYKYNVFHWHLTDDQGWRIEIKGLPELTQVGAWRVPRRGPWNPLIPPAPDEKATDGGYYSQDDIKEIVAYARQRYIDVLPEIDVPAHSLALIASYPNLSCTQLRYDVTPGYAPDSTDDVLCVANDSTWLILDKIFTQIAQLFPYEYIHTGGDEANRSFWMKDPKDIALMKKEGISNPAELQSYFEKKLEKLILSKGKKMIGWDEIVEGGLAPEAVVMSWRGMKGGIEAAKMGHEVIMTPILETYLSRKQGDPSLEPVGPGLLRLSTCYNFEPVPDGVDPKYILGGQASTWTERIPNYRHLEYMTWPRAMAIAEVLWSPKHSPTDKPGWSDFTGRVERQFPYLEAAHVKYSRSMFDPIVTGIKAENDSMNIEISSDVAGLTFYYTFDGTDPDDFYPGYSGKPISVPKGATEIRVISYRDGHVIGRQLNKPLADLRKELAKKKQ